MLNCKYTKRIYKISGYEIVIEIVTHKRDTKQLNMFTWLDIIIIFIIIMFVHLLLVVSESYFYFPQKNIEL